MQLLLPAYIVDHVKQNLGNLDISDQCDRPWWKLTSSRMLTVSSAWNLKRHRHEQSKKYDKIWVKGFPLKICVFLWRLWKSKIPIDEVLARIGFSIVSRCGVLFHTSTETMDHLFLTCEFTTKVW